MNTLDTFSRPLYRYGDFVPRTSAADQIANNSAQPCQRMAIDQTAVAETQNGYVFGRLRVQFPTESVQREFNRIARLPGEKALDAASAKQLLSDDVNFDLAHDLDWILTVDGKDSYLVQARSDMELKQMIQSLVMTPGEIAYHVVTGVIGSDVSLTNGQTLPTLRCDFLMAFTFKEFINRIVQETGIEETLATDMFEKLLILSNNPGRELTDIALNYSMLNCMSVYQFAGQLAEHGSDSSKSYNFIDAFVVPAKLQGQKQLVDVIYKYKMRGSDQTILRACQIDVSHEYPYLTRPLEHYCPSP
ncbi:hypothetical protein [Marinomonas balearica]|uniref:Uncharacterized protein n=1 Tax=Marinomonas balearica TaxID=491947 RepID=A0A4R6M6J0_9GAMM|nr:hypothetical protein [Marinomonas balearica]TDO96716.1 hypothetical protein DFP79_2481 [Marinomonas balearica]